MDSRIQTTWSMLLSFLVAVLLVLVRDISGSGIVDSVETMYCTFFDNRAPSPQPGLRNCTWYKENSCCKQEEIDATFGTVKPLPGSSPDCQRYTNYLMCYVCAPYQNVFYTQEKLTVCEEFCNAWYAACSSAILKGSVIGDLYTNGREFCLNRNFKCEPVINNRCFTTVDATLHGINSGSMTRAITRELLAGMACLFNILSMRMFVLR